MNKKIWRCAILRFWFLTLTPVEWDKTLIRTLACRHQSLKWSELVGSMHVMPRCHGFGRPSGDNDADFVRLMLPHHQAGY